MDPRPLILFARLSPPSWQPSFLFFYVVHDRNSQPWAPPVFSLPSSQKLLHHPALTLALQIEALVREAGLGKMKTSESCEFSHSIHQVLWGLWLQPFCHLLGSASLGTPQTALPNKPEDNQLGQVSPFIQLLTGPNLCEALNLQGSLKTTLTSSPHPFPKQLQPQRMTVTSSLHSCRGPHHHKGPPSSSVGLSPSLFQVTA
jgi:hypothetical protein